MVYVILLIFVIWPFIICPAALIICLAAFTFSWVRGFLLPVPGGAFLVLTLMGWASPFRRYILWKTARQLLTLPIFFLIAVFLLGGTIVFGPEMWVRMIPAKTRFPISTPEAIAVDSKGQIYLYSAFYSRFQLFNAKGEFLRGWFPPIEYKKMVDRIWINEDDHLAVERQRGPILFFNANGELINKTQTRDSEKKYEPRETKDIFGNTYKIRRQLLSPKIVKITPSGQESILVKDPFSLWLVTMPLPGFLILFASFFIIAISGLREQIFNK